MRLSWLGVAVLALFTFVVVAPGCGRASLELETLPDAGLPTDGGADSGPARKCGPSTCPSGCCDASGTCQTGTDTKACGSLGITCSNCITEGLTFCDAKQACGKNVKTCDECSATQCCSADDTGQLVCFAGVDAKACGTGAQQCTDCNAEGRSCDISTRACSAATCDATSCNGCCVGSTCLPGDDAKACGIKGTACASCDAAGQTCGADGTCGGAAKCGPANCGGCCDATGICKGGGGDTTCGKGGVACSNCNAQGEICAPLNTPNERTCEPPPFACGPSTCKGCCDAGGNCNDAPNDNACGLGGVACTACGPGDFCQGGQTCAPVTGCGPSSGCTTCCIGNMCVKNGNSNTACGAGGKTCDNCAAQGESCQGNVCQKSACDPNTCNGCCDPVQGCVPLFMSGPGAGQDDNTCGFGGQACQDCTVFGETCDFGQCQAVPPPCGPGTCNGCCRANGSCASGASSQNCGGGGESCINCAVTGASCDNGQCTGSGTCPSPYGGCDPALTTPVTPTLQGVCDDNTLSALGTACTNGADRPGCQGALQLLDNVNPACSACLRPFAVDFDQATGILLCIAPDEDATCNNSGACFSDCLDVSCNQCTTQQAQDNCENMVTDTNGACAGFADDTQTCADDALAADPLCDPNTYNDFGEWFQAVGAHFCGNGP